MVEVGDLVRCPATVSNTAYIGLVTVVRSLIGVGDSVTVQGGDITSRDGIPGRYTWRGSDLQHVDETPMIPRT